METSNIMQSKNVKQKRVSAVRLAAPSVEIDALDDIALKKYIDTPLIPPSKMLPLDERFFVAKTKRKDELAKLLEKDPERALNEIAQHLRVKRKRLYK